MVVELSVKVKVDCDFLRPLKIILVIFLAVPVTVKRVVSVIVIPV